MSILIRVTCIIETSRERVLHTKLPSQIPAEQSHVLGTPKFRLPQLPAGSDTLPTSLANRDAISRFAEKRRIGNSK